MNIQAEKIKLIEWLLDVENISVLKKVAEVRAHSVEKGLPKLSIEDLQTRALDSEDAIKNGNLTTFDELKDEMKTW